MTFPFRWAGEEGSEPVGEAGNCVRVRRISNSFASIPLRCECRATLCRRAPHGPCRALSAGAGLRCVVLRPCRVLGQCNAPLTPALPRTSVMLASSPNRLHWPREHGRLHGHQPDQRRALSHRVGHQRRRKCSAGSSRCHCRQIPCGLCRRRRLCCDDAPKQVRCCWLLQLLLLLHCVGWLPTRAARPMALTHCAVLPHGSTAPLPHGFFPALPPLPLLRVHFTNAAPTSKESSLATTASSGTSATRNDAVALTCSDEPRAGPAMMAPYRTVLTAYVWRNCTLAAHSKRTPCASIQVPLIRQ